MIRGLGTDVVEIARVAAIWQRRGDSFAARVLSRAELAHFAQLAPARRAEFLAGRFAAKEAMAKAVGRGLGHLQMSEVSLTPDRSGRPIVRWNLSAAVDAQWSDAASGQWHVSISHTAQTAFAVALWETP